MSVVNSSFLPKLKNLLSQEVSELGVVYSLILIYKILEANDIKLEYPALVFTRNWVVHHKIRQDKVLVREAVIFIEDVQNRDDFLFHTRFRSEFKKFLSYYKLPDLSDERMNKFIFNLGKVVADTPIEVVKGNTKYVVKLASPPDINQSGVYIISVVLEVQSISLAAGLSSLSVTAD